MHRAIEEAKCRLTLVTWKSPNQCYWPLPGSAHALDCTPDSSMLCTCSSGLSGCHAPAATASLVPAHLPQPLSSAPKMTHVVSCQWSSPTKATGKFVSEEIWLAFPQIYKIRLEIVPLSDWHKSCSGRTLGGRRKMANHHVINSAEAL